MIHTPEIQALDDQLDPVERKLTKLERKRDRLLSERNALYWRAMYDGRMADVDRLTTEKSDAHVRENEIWRQLRVIITQWHEQSIDAAEAMSRVRVMHAARKDVAQ